MIRKAEFAAKFYVEYRRKDSQLMPSWCDTLNEAKHIANRYADDLPVISIHKPIACVSEEGKYVWLTE